jgi:EAL domain-containing protein (putative c-di-GMP-specific phosphodiesterase class I)
MGLVIEWVALNVSGVQLQQATFANKVAEILNDTNTPANLLEFEITETFLMKGLKQPVAQLEALRVLGVSLAIDDFGVGYSSLSQLKQLPTQCLKIDRSFVNDIVIDPDTCAIVEAIIAMGKTLKLETTAEGVESLEQHTLLHQLGCKKTQGYFYAKPVYAKPCPPEDIPSLYEALNERLKAL